MDYRIGFPFWKVAARIGIPLKLRVNVLFDEEAQVFVATSHDLPGLVAEARTIDELFAEVNGSIEDLLTEALHRRPPSQPRADLRLRVA